MAKAHINIGFRRLLDRTPGAARRAARRESDTALWGRMLKMNRPLATASLGGGCPVPAAKQRS
ncbi:hypothetical protein [Mycobacterium sp. E2479]|uniref:hypothetical protein n=1 Tax=Mycobacterium sp. E2479 TaxID=1834134 RepID=UPI000ACE6992|nr:hypothetical protein [Mycobacterium sp. E2479]